MSTRSRNQQAFDPSLPPENLPRADRTRLGYYNLSSQLLAVECLKRGYRPTWLSREEFTVRAGKETLRFHSTVTPATSAEGIPLAKNKSWAKDLLLQAGVSVPEGGAFTADELDRAADYAKSLGGPVVVKPVRGNKGRGVTVGPRPGREFARAFEIAAGDPVGVIVERQFVNGTEARFFVVGGRCVAVFAKRPPAVVGDGKSSVRRLVRQLNDSRLANPHLRSRMVKLTDARVNLIRDQGFQLNDILPAGHEVLIDHMASASQGGSTVDVTDQVHPSYLEVAAAAVVPFDNLSPAGVDLLAHDLTQPASADNYVVCEINSRPALGGHHFPLVGTPRNIAALVVDETLPSSRVKYLLWAAGQLPWKSRQALRQRFSGR